jgi:hypothetical protein
VQLLRTVLNDLRIKTLNQTVAGSSPVKGGDIEIKGLYLYSVAQFIFIEKYKMLIGLSATLVIGQYY